MIGHYELLCVRLGRIQKLFHLPFLMCQLLWYYLPTRSFCPAIAIGHAPILVSRYFVRLAS